MDLGDGNLRKCMYLCRRKVAGDNPRRREALWDAHGA